MVGVPFMGTHAMYFDGTLTRTRRFVNGNVAGKKERYKEQKTASRISNAVEITQAVTCTNANVRSRSRGDRVGAERECWSRNSFPWRRSFRALREHRSCLSCEHVRSCSLFQRTVRHLPGRVATRR